MVAEYGKRKLTLTKYFKRSNVLGLKNIWARYFTKKFSNGTEASVTNGVISGLVNMLTTFRMLKGGRIGSRISYENSGLFRTNLTYIKKGLPNSSTLQVVLFNCSIGCYM